MKPTRLGMALALVWSQMEPGPLRDWYEKQVLASGGTDRRLRTFDPERWVIVVEQPPWEASFGVGDVLPCPLLDCRDGGALVWADHRLYKLAAWEWRLARAENEG